MRQLISVYSRRAALVAATLGLSACVAFRPPVSVATPEQHAASLAQQGAHAEAAGEYDQLAAQAGSDSARLQMSAAEQWLAAGRSDEAWRDISTLKEPTDAGAAWHYEGLRMHIALAAGRPVDAIHAQMAAERFSGSASDRQTLRAKLWAGLRAARERGASFDPGASKDSTVRGWLELASLPVAAHASGPAAADIARWRARYPNHPALDALAAPAAVAGGNVGAHGPSAAHGVATPAALGSAGHRVALLLPLTGPAATQASTTRDGFMAALEQLPEDRRPQVTVLDTGSLSVADAFSQARAAGAQIIVGPLTRDEVAAAAELGTQPLPVLALNYLPADLTGPGGFFQFALSPEDEARQAARRVLADGHHQGVLFLPRGDWGNRVASAFTRELDSGGGSIVSQQFYDPADHNPGVAIKTLLHIDDSEARERRLQNALGTKLNFEPRHRGDAEFIFVVPLNPVMVRLIETQLKYVYAGDIPTYGISNAFDAGSADGNRDLEGLRFPQMPWLLTGDGTIDDIRTVVQQKWDQRSAWRSSLFAFGYDAFDLAAEMLQPHHSPEDSQVSGLTGQLHFDANRRVQRDLIWVRVNHDGAPVRTLVGQ